MTLSRPYILAIPSPTVMTVADSATSTAFSKSKSSFLMISLISCALICHCLHSLKSEFRNQE